MESNVLRPLHRTDVLCQGSHNAQLTRYRTSNPRRDGFLLVRLGSLFGSLRHRLVTDGCIVHVGLGTGEVRGASLQVMYGKDRTGTR